MSHKTACDKFTQDTGKKCVMPAGEYEVNLVRPLEPGALSKIKFSAPFLKMKYQWSGELEKVKVAPGVKPESNIPGGWFQRDEYREIAPALPGTSDTA
ncbi:hypothetical protein TWF696_008626 [Orbilia brochopaga]|uniref:Uncharacterized protein n=1 Tax=Orbilia brochopaga TaxID=3140254 RepID=A0AAV9UJN6_9PEZI